MYVGVAPLGTALTEDQAAQLAQLGGPVFVATDADLAGRMAAERAHWLLSQHNVPTFSAPLPEGTDPADLLHNQGANAVTGAMLGSSPLADLLLEERLSNLPAGGALEPAARALATADPSSWERTCTEIVDRLGTDEKIIGRALHQAVRAWHDDPHAVARQQLDNARDVRARLEAAARQAPEQHWAPTADRLGPRLTAQEECRPWPTSCSTCTTKATTYKPWPRQASPTNPWCPPARHRRCATASPSSLRSPDPLLAQGRATGT